MRLLLIGGLGMTLGSAGLRAQSSVAGEYEIKAAFLLNFAKFVTWPSSAFSSPDAPLTIGVLGSDPFGGALNRVVNGARVSGREVRVARVGSAADARKCHIVFVSGSDSGRAGEILAGLQGSSVLTVGEDAQFARQGGVINFVIQSGKVRFEINAGAAKRAGLKVSSQLLKLGIIVG